MALGAELGFQTWERLSNPDVYCIALREGHVEISRPWVPASPPPNNGVEPTR